MYFTFYWKKTPNVTSHKLRFHYRRKRANGNCKCKICRAYFSCMLISCISVILWHPQGHWCVSVTPLKWRHTNYKKTSPITNGTGDAAAMQQQRWDTKKAGSVNTQGRRERWGDENEWCWEESQGNFQFSQQRGCKTFHVVFIDRREDLFLLTMGQQDCGDADITNTSHSYGSF